MDTAGTYNVPVLVCQQQILTPALFVTQPGCLPADGTFANQHRLVLIVIQELTCAKTSSSPPKMNTSFVSR